ncbi:MAG TPA: hypothetical protein PLH31_06685, partial [Caulobacter sp.]
DVEGLRMTPVEWAREREPGMRLQGLSAGQARRALVTHRSLPVSTTRRITGAMIGWRRETARRRIGMLKT